MSKSSFLLYFFLLIIHSGLIVGCSSKKGVVTFDDQPATKIDPSELCYIEFYKANNQVKIYIDNELVHDTSPINDHLTSESTVALSEYLSPGNHKIKLELFNGEGLSTDLYDHHWQVHYELFFEGEPIHFVNEKNSDGEIGLVWSTTHEIEVN